MPTKKEKGIIRDRIYRRSNGDCEDCGKWMIEERGEWNSMHLSHTKSKGAGGSWEEENLKGLCMDCHLIGVHNPKSVPSKR